MKYKLIILILIFVGIVLYRFYDGRNREQAVDYKIIGGIVPHHLYVQDIISNFFSSLKTNDIDQVILIGPNHLELGDQKVIYNPDFSDQSMESVMPYVRNTFPQTKITQIVLKRQLSLSECAALAKELESLDGNNLLVASIDFSHYLPSSKAEENDQIILSMIRNRDYAAILNLNSEYLDSPPSLVVALMYFELRGLTHLTILDNANSGERGNRYAPTTSYFSMIFYGKN